MRTIASSALCLSLVAVTALPVGAQTILGYRFDLKGKPGFPTTRKLSIKSQENLSPEIIDGDPATNGAVVQIIVNGGTSTSQTITLPSGARWRRSPSNPLLPATGWKYRESLHFGYVTPVTSLVFAKSSSGKFKLQATLYGKHVPVTVDLPNPGTSASMVLSIPGGATYCTNFGGVAGGLILRNDAVYFRISKPTAEGTCPSGVPVCGDGVVDAPFETCDGSNDGACPGLCGANGLPCECPFCGDGVVDPGESCDVHTLGSCTEGCSRQCTCTVCGDGIAQGPGEDCEPGDDCGNGLCGALGAPNQCKCPFCGDGIVNATGEECDGADDGACPGLCVAGECTCPVCGNGNLEPGEQCDGSDSPCGEGSWCAADCTCTVCGDGVITPPEQCEPSDDSACPGLCDFGCMCP